MNIIESTGRRRRAGKAAFTLIEVLVAVALILVAFIGIYGGISMGLKITQSSRENLRATQIMLDKMESVRLYRWDQLTNSSASAVLVPAFTNWFFETNNIGMANASGSGVRYIGMVSVANSGLDASYADSMRKVTVEIKWVSGDGRIAHTNSMSTLVSQQGLQNYIYNN